MRKEAKPRIIGGIHRGASNVHQGKTWLEAEEFAYPSGGFHRRAYVRCPDGKYRVVKCSIPDTYFTIPAHLVYKRKHVSGYVSTDEKHPDKEFVFLPTGKHRGVFDAPIVHLGGSPEKEAILGALTINQDRLFGRFIDPSEMVRIPKEILEAPAKHRTATEIKSLGNL